MNRTRRARSSNTRTSEADAFDAALRNLDRGAGGAATSGLDRLSDEELAALLFSDEDEGGSLWNLPTAAGLSLIGVGGAYLLQQLGLWTGLDLSIWVQMLPWLAGILIILIGFGVLSWQPKKKRKKKKAAATIADVAGEASPEKKKKRFTKSRRDRKVFGVCGGIADYLSIDPTIVRLFFVLGTIAGQGTFFAAYLVLAYLLPKADTLTPEERLRIIRES